MRLTSLARRIVRTRINGRDARTFEIYRIFVPRSNLYEYARTCTNMHEVNRASGVAWYVGCVALRRRCLRCVTLVQQACK